jgi:hypothetical protein
LIALVVLAAIVGHLSSGRPKLPGSLGTVATQVRIGMSRDELATVIRDSQAARKEYDLSRLYTRGVTRDGRSFGRYCDWSLSDVPSADQIAWAEFDVDDDWGRDLIITLGPGGVVTDLRLESDSIWEELRYALAPGTGWRGWPTLKKHRPL